MSPKTYYVIVIIIIINSLIMIIIKTGFISCEVIFNIALLDIT